MMYCLFFSFQTKLFFTLTYLNEYTSCAVHHLNTNYYSCCSWIGHSQCDSSSQLRFAHQHRRLCPPYCELPCQILLLCLTLHYCLLDLFCSICIVNDLYVEYRDVLVVLVTPELPCHSLMNVTLVL